MPSDTPEQIATRLTKAHREAFRHVFYAKEWACWAFLAPLIHGQTIRSMQRLGLFNRRSVTPLGLAVRAAILRTANHNQQPEGQEK